MAMDEREKVEFPNQSDRGKCELRIDKQNKLYCEDVGCEGNCALFSLPRTNPRAEPREEEQPCEPKEDRYYYCKCMPEL